MRFGELYKVKEISHNWIGERNNNRKWTDACSYTEVELSELLAVADCGLIRVFIHWNIKGFLQADALCVLPRNDRLFMLSVPSRYDGGPECNYSLTERLDGTVCDDIILRFDQIPDGSSRKSFPPTWIAAVYEKEKESVIELYGNLIDYDKMGLYLPSILRSNAAFKDDLPSASWYESPWSEVFSCLYLP